jgi:hypothetical protein
MIKKISVQHRFSLNSAKYGKGKPCHYRALIEKARGKMKTLRVIWDIFIPYMRGSMWAPLGSMIPFLP